MTAPAPVVSADLRALLRRLKLGQALDTLPERLALAAQHRLGHADFLEQLLCDEVSRRDRTSAALRARAAHLDPKMTLDRWDPSAQVSYDHAVLDELVSLRFVEAAHNVFVLGPVGVGKTFIATALGHIACRRRIKAHFERADKLFRRLKAARLDASYDAEVRKLIGADLLIIDLSRGRDYPDVAWSSASTARCWWASRDSRPRADRDNHKLSRKAMRLSGGRYRPGLEEGGVIRARARSLIVMSACR
jgi:hypothetical protein